MYWPVVEAKNKFSSVLAESLKGEPQFITKNGKMAAVLVSAEDYLRLFNSSGNFKDFLLSAPKVDVDFERIEGPVRELPW